MEIFSPRPQYDPYLLEKCPYCWEKNKKIFRKQRKCELCGKVVYLHAGDDRQKRLYTYDEITAIRKAEKEKEYSMWLDTFEYDDFYKEIKHTYPKQTQKEWLIRYYLYQIDYNTYYHNIDEMSTQYAWFSRFLEHEEMMRDAYIAKMMCFLLSAFSWFFYFWMKDEADIILSTQSDTDKQEWQNKVIEKFNEASETLDMPKESSDLKKFITWTYEELQNYSANFEWVGYLNNLRKIHLDYMMNANIENFKKPIPKHIEKKFWL